MGVNTDGSVHSDLKSIEGETETEDGGVTWLVRDNGATSTFYTFRSVYCADTSSCFLASGTGSYGMILRSIIRGNGTFEWVFQGQYGGMVSPIRLFSQLYDRVCGRQQSPYFKVGIPSRNTENFD